MARVDPVAELGALSRRFGKEAAAAKVRLLETIAGERRISAPRLAALHDVLLFLCAYPDDASVLARVEALLASIGERVRALAGGESDPRLAGRGLPGSHNSYPYSYAALRRLVALFPGALSIDWEASEDPAPLTEALLYLVSPGETQAIEDLDVSLEEWLEAATGGERTDLEVVLGLFEASGLGERERAGAYDRCGLACRYRFDAGNGRGELRRRVGPVRFQRGDLRRERFDVRTRIRRPLPPSAPRPRTEGRRLLDLALAALASRNLEIYPLMHGDSSDVRLVDVGRGLAVMLSGVRPEMRSPLEAVYFFAILKNGVPIAYGPASSFLGACEMGINLFPEFRGGEIRYLYAQFLRVLHHHLHVRYFFLTPYGMGEGNEEALASGAFWFYRKLGFAVLDPEVDALARREEARMATQPGHRSSRATLRRLSHTGAYLDLSGGRCRPFPFGALGMAVTRSIAAGFGGDRARAAAECGRRLSRVLDVPDLERWPRPERAAFAALAPVLHLLPDLETWSRRDRRALVSIVRAKGRPGEDEYVRRVLDHPRLGPELRTVAESPAPRSDPSRRR